MDFLKDLNDLPKDKAGMILFIVVAGLAMLFKVYYWFKGKSIEKEKERKQNTQDSQSNRTENNEREDQHRRDGQSARDHLRD